MKKRFTPAQIAFALRQAASGTPISEITRKMGVTDVTFYRWKKLYANLGACNPPNAYKALQTEPDIGLMLPCNVVVYEGEGGATVVAAVDPLASMRAVENIGLEATAIEVGRKLQRVIEAMERES